MKFGTALFFLIFLSISCSKDKYASIPQLTLKEMSGNYVPIGGGMQFTLEFTDAEGDITGNVGVQKISSTCDQSSYLDTSSFLIPSFPSTHNQKGDILLTFSTIYIHPISCNGQDTLEQAVFRFWIHDKAGNVSDTVTAPPITVAK